MLQHIPHLYSNIDGTKRTINVFDRYMTNCRIGIEKIIQENQIAVTNPIPSRSIDLLNKLIVLTDSEYIMSKTNDFERFKAIEYEIDRTFGSYLREPPFQLNVFYKTKKIATTEAILFAQSRDLVDTLPFGEPFSSWKDLNPVSVISNDSSEYTVHNTLSYLRYEFLPPSFSTVMIDLMLFLNLYYKYRLTHADSIEEFGIRVDNYPFIYRFCLAPLLRSLFVSWVLNIIKNVIEARYTDKAIRYMGNDLIGYNKAYFVHNGMLEFVVSINSMIDRYQKGNIKFDVLFRSLIVWEGMSLSDYINTYLVPFMMKSTHGSDVMYFMRDLTIVEIILGLNRIRSNDPIIKKVYRLIDRYLRRFERRRIWEHGTDPITKDFIEQKLKALRE